MARGAPTTERFQDAMKRLLHFSLVDARCGEFPNYNIHPLVHEWIVERLTRDEKRKYLERILDDAGGLRLLRGTCFMCLHGPMLHALNGIDVTEDENAKSQRRYEQAIFIMHITEICKHSWDLELRTLSLCLIYYTLSSGSMEFNDIQGTASYSRQALFVTRKLQDNDNKDMISRQKSFA
jgi:hypothetical protein